MCITVDQVKSGRCFQLVPYKSTYMIATDEHGPTIQYLLINIELGIVSCRFPNVALVLEFLNRWKAKTAPALPLSSA